MMKSSMFLKLTFSLVLLLLLNVFAFGQKGADGHRIEVTVDGWTDTISYLGYYIGEKTYIEDTATVMNNKAVFQGVKNLTPGMYFVYTPGNLFFELLVNEDDFELSTSIENINAAMQVKGSPENELFFEYQNKMSAFQSTGSELSNRLKYLTGADSVATIDKLRSVNDEVQEYQRSQKAKNKGTFFAEILSLILRPESIEAPSEMAEEQANEYRFRKYKSLYWEGTDFNNPGTIRNPIFDAKINEYFEKLVYSLPDSVSKAIDTILSQEIDTVVYRYLVVTLTNKYATSKQMGMDAVYVHMIENYYSTGKAYWIDETTLTRMEQNSERLKPILIGKKAPLFKSETLTGDLISDPYAATDKDYKIVFFYDSGCGHCKESIPKVMTAYNALKDSNVSAELITMNLSEDKEEWQKFVDKYQVKGLILGDTKGFSNAGYYYYVDSTPQIYIVDKNNEIIAKKLAAQYIDDFILDYIKLN
ncbi:MAG: TlpA disulfide reductase family protein [Bacteroidota bacterium]